MQFEVALITVRAPFAYQAIAAQAAILARLGMTASAIARRLGVTDKTVAKAIRLGRAGELTALPVAKATSGTRRAGRTRDGRRAEDA